MRILKIVAPILVAALLLSGKAGAQVFVGINSDSEGNVPVPGFVLPPAKAASEESRQAMINAAKLMTAHKGSALPDGVDHPGPAIDGLRAVMDQMMRPKVDTALKMYPVDIVRTEVGGVPANIVTPEGGIAKANKNRVLINLHGGAWMIGGGPMSGLIESIPVASVAQMKVIAVDYRLGPENRHPAATEDLLKVYAELRKTYKPRNIGIYGCSSGGLLTPMVTAEMIKRKLPIPGAIGIYGAGATTERGDSYYIAAALAGVSLPLPQPELPSYFTTGYFADSDRSDPALSPVDHTELLAKFPPTQIITASRALDLSPSIITHTALVKQGVDAELHVWEGLGHCFILDNTLPEARDAYVSIAKFFTTRLGK
jgi:epsilon-lactone hydrolase